jgi:hypothetical protein
MYTMSSSLKGRTKRIINWWCFGSRLPRVAQELRSFFLTQEVKIHWTMKWMVVHIYIYSIYTQYIYIYI